MLAPASTGFGESVMVTAMSAWLAAATVTLAVALLLALLGSVIADDPISVSEMTVPVAVPGFTCATNEKAAVPPNASEAMLQEMLPVAPTAGVAQVHVPGFVRETKVVLVGTASVKLTVVAVDGPLLVSDCE